PARPELGAQTARPDLCDRRIAEDAVGRPEAGWANPKPVLDRRDPPLEVLDEGAGWQAQHVSVPVTMQGHAVAGGPDLARTAGVALDLLAAEKESRGSSAPLQLREHGRGSLGMRAIVEGDRDAARLMGAARQPERRSDPGDDRGEGG